MAVTLVDSSLHEVNGQHEGREEAVREDDRDTDLLTRLEPLVGVYTLLTDNQCDELEEAQRETFPACRHLVKYSSLYSFVCDKLLTTQRTE